MLDKLLEKTGYTYEDLTSDERATLNGWLEVLSKGGITQEKIKNYISSMKETVEAELTKTDLNTKQDLFLKARLRNYMLLDAFLGTPERAKAQLEQALSGMIKRKWPAND